MNILIASESFYPSVSGVAITSERLASQMAARGHTVSVLAPSLTRGYHEEERCGYTIYRIPSWRNPFRKGFRYTILPRKFVRAVFKAVNPEVVHVQDPASLSATAVRQAKRLGVPVVVTNHFTLDYILTYLPWLKWFHPLVRWIFQYYLYRFYNQADVLTVPTLTVKEMLTYSGPRLKPPIRVISNGVDVGRFSLYYAPTEFRRRFRVRADLPVITYVGRLDPEKNITTLLDALSRLQCPFQAVILGSGNCQAELKEEASSLGLDNKIIWIDRLDNRSSLLNQLYQLTTVFCMPSLMETESMVTMEAMASGVPVIASKVGALPELVESGRNGYLVPAKKPVVWQQKIEQILKDPQLRTEMATQSIEKIAQRDLPRTIDKFEELYIEMREAHKSTLD